MSKTKQVKVTIPLEVWAELQKDSYLLNLLECAGVDNWEGYGIWYDDEPETEEPQDYKERIIKEYIENENKKGEQE